MAETGRAVIYEGHREPPDVFRIVEYPVPEPRPGAVLLRLTLANICGSDVHTYRGEGRSRNVNRPRNPGHEGTGLRGGPGGRCHDGLERRAARGRRPRDLRAFLLLRALSGLPRGTGVVLPDATRAHERVERRLAALPGHVRGLSLSLPGAHAVQDTGGAGGPRRVRHQLRPDAGPLRVRRGRPRAGRDRRDSGRRRAGDLRHRRSPRAWRGPDHRGRRRSGAARSRRWSSAPTRSSTCASSRTPEQRIRRVKELTSGWGADLVLEVVGYPAVVEEGLQMVGSGGRYVEMGCRAPHLSYTAIPEQWATGNLTIYGSNNYGRRHLRDAIDFLRRTQGAVSISQDHLAQVSAGSRERCVRAAEHRPRDAREPGALTASRETIPMDLGIKGKRAIITGGSTRNRARHRTGAASRRGARGDLRARRGAPRADPQGAGGGAGRRGARRAGRHAEPRRHRPPRRRNHPTPRRRRHPGQQCWHFPLRAFRRDHRRGYAESAEHEALRVHAGHPPRRAPDEGAELGSQSSISSAARERSPIRTCWSAA